MRTELTKRLALLNIANSPVQDKQYILKPFRLTEKGGVTVAFNNGLIRIILPTLNQLYHVFQLGRISPNTLGISDKIGIWQNFNELDVFSNTYSDVYNNSGIQIPKKDVFYLVEDNNIFIAIRENSKINVNYGTEDLFIKICDNAFYARGNNNVSVLFNKIDTTNTAEILEIQRNYNSLKNYNRFVRLFINGYLVNDFVFANIKLGDIIEFVYDDSVFELVSFNVHTLPIFESTEDKENKYILHLGNGTDVTYLDDVDIYLFNTDSGKGVYVNRNSSSFSKNLTHKDLSISVKTISDILRLNNFNANKTILRAYLKKSGLDRTTATGFVLTICRPFSFDNIKC